jgi:hypothetical protein
MSGSAKNDVLTQAALKGKSGIFRKRWSTAPEVSHIIAPI